MTVKIDMEMPKSCSECRLFCGDISTGNYCKITLKEIDYYGITRHPKCPLQEVKECK